VRALPPRPSVRTREEPEDEPEEGGWFRIAAAAVLAIGGCSLGYLGMRQPDEPAPAPHVQNVTKPAPLPGPPPSARARPPELRPAEAARSPVAGHKEPEPPKPVPQARVMDQQPPRQAGIYESLDRWATAMRRGDASAAAALYAPRVTDYLGRRDVTRQQVKERLRGYLGTRNRMDIYRISDLAVSRVRDGEVEVTFQKHWQTGGYRKLSGDARERMVLVRNRAGQWEIASEQELPLR
jgi:hypothetical protein